MTESPPLFIKVATEPSFSDLGETADRLAEKFSESPELSTTTAALSGRPRPGGAVQDLGGWRGSGSPSMPEGKPSGGAHESGGFQPGGRLHRHDRDLTDAELEAQYLADLEDEEDCGDGMMPKLAKRKYKKNYSEKKKTPTGGTVRLYSEEWVKKRWAKKVKKLKSLETGIKKLRKKYREDLHDKNDAKTRATAALVGLIDSTAIRIGNDESVGEAGTFGATTLQKKHAKVSGGKIRFKFKGKDGVDQDLTLDDRAVVSEIKKLLEGKKPSDLIFEYEKGERISGKIVNRYLKDWGGLTAKDVRGFHANHLMKEKLKKTKDFEKALEETADEIGHKPATLKNQYLDPALVKKYEKKEASLPPLFLKTAEDDYKGNLEHAFDQVLNGGPVNTTWQGQNLLPQEQRQKLEQNKTPSPTRPSSGKQLGGARSRYDHLSHVFVQVGQEVRKGETIGLSGHTGNVTGPHLHVEFYAPGSKHPSDSQAYAHEFYPTFTISSGYGARHIPGRAPDTHQATDIAMHDGTPVAAWADGKITVVQYGNASAGNWVELSHFAATPAV